MPPVSQIAQDDSSPSASTVVDDDSEEGGPKGSLLRWIRLRSAMKKKGILVPSIRMFLPWVRVLVLWFGCETGGMMGIGMSGWLQLATEVFGVFGS